MTSLGRSYDEAVVARDASHRAVMGLIEEVERVPRETQDAAIKRGFEWGQWLNWQATYVTWYDRTKDWWKLWNDSRNVFDEADQWVKEAKVWRKRATDSGMFNAQPGSKVDPVTPPSEYHQQTADKRLGDALPSVINLAKWGIVGYLGIKLLSTIGELKGSK